MLVRKVEQDERTLGSGVQKMERVALINNSKNTKDPKAKRENYYYITTMTRPPIAIFVVALALLVLPQTKCSFISTTFRSNDQTFRKSPTAVPFAPVDEDSFDPDLVGVHVDGFPLPPTPVRDNDDELLASIRRIPITPLDTPLEPGIISPKRPLRVIIAGGGLGGLALASDLVQRGFDVHVFEQASQYKPFGGPIQIQSNALWALQQINPVLYSAVAECGIQTGDRLSGIKDGKRYEEGWLVKFDAATPAQRKGLPLTLAINRVVLQEIFLKYGVPQERVHTASRVVGYKNLNHGIKVQLEDGRFVYADILVGADGIWSCVRHQMAGLPMDEMGLSYATKHARYSGYSCFTGTCKHTPSDIDEVAYKVFLGQRQYLGCTDAGYGWQHWWAFLPDPPGAGMTRHRAHVG